MSHLCLTVTSLLNQPPRLSIQRFMGGKGDSQAWSHFELHSKFQGEDEEIQVQGPAQGPAASKWSRLKAN